MFLYEGLIVNNSDGTYTAVILKLNHDPEPNCDTVMEHSTSDIEEATIWLDDEMSRLTHGRGVWDV